MGLQIAPSERLRQLKVEGGDAALLCRLERAPVPSREGRAEDAVREVARPSRNAP